MWLRRGCRVASSYHRAHFIGGKRRHRSKIERLPHGHIRRRDDAVLRHQHRAVVTYRLNLVQAKRFERNQRAHALIAREDQHLHCIQRDTIDLQKLLKILEDNLRQVVNLLIHRLQRRHLNNLVDRLLHHRPRIHIHLRGRQGMAAIRHMLNQFQRILLAVDVNIIIHIIAHLSHFARERQTSGFDNQLGSVDVKRFVLPWALTAIEVSNDRTHNRLIGSHDGILTRLINVDNRAPRLENAKMVAFYGEQRPAHNVVPGIVPEEYLRPHHFLAVRKKRRNNVPNSHTQVPPLKPYTTLGNNAYLQYSRPYKHPL